MEAEEQVYAVAEQGDHYLPQPLPVWTQDLSPSSPPTQPCPSAPRALDPFSESEQVAPSFIRAPQESRRSEELRPNPAVINQPSGKPNIFSPQGTAWSPVIPPKPEFSDHREGVKQERSLSPTTSDIGEKFVRDMIDIQRQQQCHNEQLMYMQQYRDQQLQQLLGQHQQLSLTLTLPHAEVQTFDGDPVNYCNFVRSFENLIEAKTKSSSTKLY